MNKSKKGFAISELVLAFLFLTVFILVNIAMHINALKNVKEIQRQTTAVNLLIEKMEDMQLAPYEDVQTVLPYAPIENQNYQMFVTVSELANPAELSGYEDLLKIVTVNVTYTVGGINREIEMKTLKVGELVEIPAEQEV